MHELVYLPLVVPALAAAGAWPLAERLPPRTTTWLLTLSAVVLAVTSCAVLGLLALAAAMRLPVFASLGNLSARTMSRIDPSPVPLGLIAAGLLAAAALSVVRATWRRTAAMVAAHREARTLSADGRLLVIVNDDRADAYAVPGRPARIVVTSRMLDSLTEAESEVLLAHERAHASAHHYLFMAAARLSAAANPLLRPLAAAVSYSVERWADEQAALVTGSRPLAARAIAKAALATAAGERTGRGTAHVLAATGERGEIRRPGSVPRRVGALLGPPPRRRLILLALAAVVVAVSGLATVDAAGDMHAMIEFAQAAASG
jgi:beta-lactamase regulating signal transducer with metallopeptidase domain